jgi:hypothetical protein
MPAEGVGDDTVGQGRCEVGEGVDDKLPAFAVDGGQDLRAGVVPGLLDVAAERVPLADVLIVGVVLPVVTAGPFRPAHRAGPWY